MQRCYNRGEFDRKFNAMSLEQLGILRRRELELILATIRNIAPNRARVLDIGAGVGWQAALVRDAGYQVEAIDMPTSAYSKDRVFPIRDYDGKAIPFANGAFDVVYSSNVLEHVLQPEDFQDEILRVLKPTGIAIHIVPSGTWRLWSNLAHYPYMAKQGVQRMLDKPSFSSESQMLGGGERAGWGVLSALRRILLPNRDGEFGNALTEVYRFSRWCWSHHFHRSGWNIERCQSNQLFYTAYYILSKRLSIAHRARLSRLLGGSCHVFVLRPRNVRAGNR